MIVWLPLIEFIMATIAMFFLLCYVSEVIYLKQLDMYYKLERKFSFFRLFMVLIMAPITIPLSKYAMEKSLYFGIMLVAILYSLTVLYAVYNKRKHLQFLLNNTLFLDVLLVSLFILLRGGVRSDTYLLYYFIILYDGAKYGVYGTITSLVQSLIYYGLMSYGASVISSVPFDYSRFLIRVIYLITLTFIMYEINKLIKESHVNEIAAKELAYKDSLTQLPNRLQLLDYFEEKRARYDKTGESFGISIIDIDIFKQINDTKGHPFGDKVLQELAQIFTNQISSDDFVCRFGGEEFLIIYDESNKDKILNKANLLCAKIQKYDFFGEKITVSIGVSMYRNNNTMIENISLADEAMYAAKNTGKNKVIAYDELKLSLKHK